MPSEDDYANLAILGRYAMMEVVGLAVETFFWGVYALLFAYALHTQMARRRPRNWFMVAVLCYMFAASSALWALDFTETFIRIKIELTEHMESDIRDRIFAANDTLQSYGLPMEALFLINMLVGDAVVIWRAWVLWTGVSVKKRILAFFTPAILLLMSAVFTVIALVCLSESGYGAASSSPLSDSRTCLWAEPIAWAFSLVTNATTTVLVGLIAWEHRRLMMSAPSEIHSKSRVSKVLIVLVESGFLYCLFWATQIVNFIEMPDTDVVYLYFVLSRMGDQISGLYPTIIIVLVGLQQTVYDQTIGTLKLETMEFAERGAHVLAGKFTPTRSSTVHDYSTTNRDSNSEMSV